MTSSPLLAQQSHGRIRRANVGFWLIAGTYGIVMMGGTLPIPLYRFWAQAMHFGALGTTAIFAVYAFGVLVSLLVFASLSDQLGRRPVLIGALVVLGISTVLFLGASTLTGLLVARFVFGLAAGVVTATANAALAELARPDRPQAAPVMSTVANMGGLGLGSIAAGAVARFFGDPTHEVFWWYLIALGIAVLAVVVVPETVTRQAGFRLDVRRPSLPEGADRRMFLGVLGLVLAAFTVNGVFSSLVPSFVQNQLHIEDSLASSALVSIVFFAALLAQVMPRPQWLNGPFAGPTVLVIGSVVFEAGLLAGSLLEFILGTVIAGAGVGLVFGRGIGITQHLADPERRADLVATYFLAAYLGSTMPTLGLGVLNQTLGTTGSTLILFGVIVGVTIISTALTARRTSRS
ncbi:MFS transporter [Arthrobacter sp. ISL-69]|uniref:MFS transporter n=1 Tax=Arthrobacter sp. ISL-69 TaxID=2819113 RepID=UPI001BE56A92|nr:MFS transporter [Arthrobacter sp. ISL-69]MBT2535431.1 MFS transporter [Arthrobacter sp. ISL-69]